MRDEYFIHLKFFKIYMLFHFRGENGQNRDSYEKNDIIILAASCIALQVGDACMDTQFSLVRNSKSSLITVDGEDDRLRGID